MKRITLLLFLLTLCAAATLHAENKWSFKGKVIRMRMTDCTLPNGFKTSFMGVPSTATLCPEYTVMGPTVVYVVVGRRSEAVIPLAEELDFVIQKNELVTFSDDEKSKLRFLIQQMTLREDWEREKVANTDRGLTYEVRNPSGLR